MAAFQVLRIALHGTLLLLSLIVLGLSAHLLEIGFLTLGLPVATSVLTLITILPITVIDFLRKGSATSWVVVELGLCGFLTILWLASAALVTDVLTFWVGSAVVALKAFTWLGWIIIASYTSTLLLLAIRQKSSGNAAIWKTSLSDFDFFAPSTQIPPAPMQSYPNGPTQQFSTHPTQYQPQQYAPVTQQYTGSVAPQHTGQASYTGAAHV